MHNDEENDRNSRNMVNEILFTMLAALYRCILGLGSMQIQQCDQETICNQKKKKHLNGNTKRLETYIMFKNLRYIYGANERFSNTSNESAAM